MTDPINPWFVLGLDFGTYGRSANAAMARQLQMLRDLSHPAFDRAAVVSAAGDLQDPPETPDTTHWRVPAIGWPADPPQDSIGTLRPPPVPLLRRTDPVDRDAAVHTAQQVIGDYLQRIAAEIDSADPQEP